MTAGEQLHASPAVRAFFTRHPGCRLHNQYGPDRKPRRDRACSWPPTRANGRPCPPSAGPMANNRIHVLDRHGRVAPLGVAGEIHIGGVGVARGYLHRPELTAERFVADPFSDDPDARLYKHRRHRPLARRRRDRLHRPQRPPGEGARLPRRARRDRKRAADAPRRARRRRAGAPRRRRRRAPRSPMSPPSRAPRPAPTTSAPTSKPRWRRTWCRPVRGARRAARSPNGKIDRRALPEPLAQRPEMAEPYEEGRTDHRTPWCAPPSRAPWASTKPAAPTTSST